CIATSNDGASGLPPILLRYIQALLTQIAQQSACNRSHLIAQRCARWILMTHDRAGSAEFPLTHEFLAYMLGARRASVSIAARTLAKAGLISYTRGSIHVLTYSIESGSKRRAASAMGLLKASTTGCCP